MLRRDLMKTICLIIFVCLVYELRSFAVASQNAQVTFRRVFLIGVVLTSSGEATLDPPSRWHRGTHDLVNVVGDVDLGWSALWDSDIEAPAFWQDKVKANYALPLQSIGEFRPILGIVELRAEALPQLTSLSGYEFSCKQEELFDKIFSSWKQQVSPGSEAGACQKYAKVLYLEPKDPIALHQPWSGHQEELSAQLHAAGYPSPVACVPSLVVDTIIACGAGSSWDDLSSTAIRVKPVAVSQPDKEVPVSRVATSLADYFSNIEVLRETERRILNLPFSKSNIHEYLQTRVNATHGSVSEHYQQFLQDRQLAIEERFRANAILDSVNAELKRNVVLRSSQKISFTAISEGDIVQQDYLEAAQQLSADDIARINNSLTLVANRDAALADYLRDATTAEATVANLGLQHHVEYLTYVAISIAVAGLFVGLVSEDKKRALVHWAIRRFRDIRRWKDHSARPEDPSRGPHDRKPPVTCRPDALLFWGSATYVDRDRGGSVRSRAAGFAPREKRPGLRPH